MKSRRLDWSFHVSTVNSLCCVVTMTNSSEDKITREDTPLDKSSSPGRDQATVKDTLAEASEYVDSIMSSQRISKVDTPHANRRKRNLSLPETSDASAKKARGVGDVENESEDIENENEKRSSRKARRNLNNKGACKVPQSLIVTEADVHVSATPSVQQLFAKLSADMNMMFMSVNERLDKIDSGLEKRIATKVSQILDKRVNSEMNKIRADFDSRLEDFKESLRAEVAADLDDIRTEVKSRDSGSQNSHSERDISLNIVIRNLPESHNENIKNKVNSLLRDGLRLSDVSVDEAERKQSHTDTIPGVVIARMKSKQDKTRVMKEKRRLKESRQFAKVFIHHDMHPSQRSVSSNFRRIVHAMKSNASNLSMRGSRILYDRDNLSSNNTRESRDDHSSSRYNQQQNDRQPDRPSGRSRDPDSNRHDGNRQYYGNGRDYNSNYRNDSYQSGRDYRQERPRDGRRWRD